MAGPNDPTGQPEAPTPEQSSATLAPPPPLLRRGGPDGRRTLLRPEGIDDRTSAARRSVIDSPLSQMSREATGTGLLRTTSRGAPVRTTFTEVDPAGLRHLPGPEPEANAAPAGRFKRPWALAPAASRRPAAAPLAAGPSTMLPTTSSASSPDVGGPASLDEVASPPPTRATPALQATPPLLGAARGRVREQIAAIEARNTPTRARSTVDASRTRRPVGEPAGVMLPSAAPTPTPTPTEAAAVTPPPRPTLAATGRPVPPARPPAARDARVTGPTAAPSAPDSASPTPEAASTRPPEPSTAPPTPPAKTPRRPLPPTPTPSAAPVSDAPERIVAPPSDRSAVETTGAPSTPASTSPPTPTSASATPTGTSRPHTGPTGPSAPSPAVTPPPSIAAAAVAPPVLAATSLLASAARSGSPASAGADAVLGPDRTRDALLGPSPSSAAPPSSSPSPRGLRPPPIAVPSAVLVPTPVVAGIPTPLEASPVQAGPPTDPAAPPSAASPRRPAPPRSAAIPVPIAAAASAGGAIPSWLGVHRQRVAIDHAREAGSSGRGWMQRHRQQEADEVLRDARARGLDVGALPPVPDFTDDGPDAWEAFHRWRVAVDSVRETDAPEADWHEQRLDDDAAALGVPAAGAAATAGGSLRASSLLSSDGQAAFPRAGRVTQATMPTAAVSLPAADPSGPTITASTSESGEPAPTGESGRSWRRGAPVGAPSASGRLRAPTGPIAAQHRRLGSTGPTGQTGSIGSGTERPTTLVAGTVRAPAPLSSGSGTVDGAPLEQGRVALLRPPGPTSSGGSGGTGRSTGGPPRSIGARTDQVTIGGGEDEPESGEKTTRLKLSSRDRKLALEAYEDWKRKNSGVPDRMVDRNVLVGERVTLEQKEARGRRLTQDEEDRLEVLRPLTESRAKAKFTKHDAARLDALLAKGPLSREEKREGTKLAKAKRGVARQAKQDDREQALQTRLDELTELSNPTSEQRREIVMLRRRLEVEEDAPAEQAALAKRLAIAAVRSLKGPASDGRDDEDLEDDDDDDDVPSVAEVEELFQKALRLRDLTSRPVLSREDTRLGARLRREVLSAPKEMRGIGPLLQTVLRSPEALLSQGTSTSLTPRSTSTSSLPGPDTTPPTMSDVLGDPGDLPRARRSSNPITLRLPTTGSTGGSQGGGRPRALAVGSHGTASSQTGMVLLGGGTSSASVSPEATADVEAVSRVIKKAVDGAPSSWTAPFRRLKKKLLADVQHRSGVVREPNAAELEDLLAQSRGSSSTTSRFDDMTELDLVTMLRAMAEGEGEGPELLRRVGDLLAEQRRREALRDHR